MTFYFSTSSLGWPSITGWPSIFQPSIFCIFRSIKFEFHNYRGMGGGMGGGRGWKYNWPTITAIETRWNSEYLKEKRLFENREPLMLSVSQLKSNNFRSLEEWEKTSQFLAMLKPFYGATVISSGEKYVSLSTIIPLLLGLEKNTKKLKKRMKNDENFGYLFCKSLLKSLQERFPRNYKDSKNHLLAMLLDLRFKDVLVENESPRARKELPNFIKSV